MEIKKPETFKELLELQRILDENTSKPRDNGFIPRERTGLDILLSLDDEFQEWLKELPKDANFKTWKQKEYNRDRELEEFVDVLFFFLQLVNNLNKYDCPYIYLEKFNETFDGFTWFSEIRKTEQLLSMTENFKKHLWTQGYFESFYYYIQMASERGFFKKEIIEMYYKKWQKNMKRINQDWSLKED